MDSFSRKSVLVAVLASVGLLCGLSSTAQALATYSYTGSNYTTASLPFTTSMSQNGTVTLSAALGSNLVAFNVIPLLVSFSVTDGITTYTELSTYTQTEFFVDTDASGNITDWDFALYANDNARISCNTPITVEYFTTVCTIGSAGDISSYDTNSGSATVFVAGTWSLIPEPGTGLLVMTGLVGLAYRQRRLGRSA